MNLQQIKLWSETITALHSKWVPHDGQKPIIDAVFADGVLSLFIRCGRKKGKTEEALYLLWRIAQSFPNSPCYYFTPLQVQTREIVWTDPRIVSFGPREWLLDGSRGVNEQQMLLRFKNGSFIKLDGTDNFNKYRGVRYKIAIYDEYKDCDPRMRKGMRPNASVLNGIDVYMGSPPDVNGTDYEALDKEHQSDPTMRAFHMPTWSNPHISKDWLRKEKARLYKKGDGAEWEREYGAKYVIGGAASIFPMVSDCPVVPHDKLMKELERDRKKLKWYWWADPAGASCFAVLFVAINPYTKTVYWLDEIYETSQMEMTTKKIGSRVIEKRNELFDRKGAWRQGYDEAATWFVNEWIDNFPMEDNLEPSHKAQNDKHDGLSLLKDIMLSGRAVFSDRCVNTRTEFENYQKDKNGKIPKLNDHQIDNSRYILAADGYTLKTEHEYKEEVDPDFRGERMEDAFYGDKGGDYEFL